MIAFAGPFTYDVVVVFLAFPHAFLSFFLVCHETFFDIVAEINDDDGERRTNTNNTQILKMHVVGKLKFTFILGIEIQKAKKIINKKPLQFKTEKSIISYRVLLSASFSQYTMIALEYIWWLLVFYNDAISHFHAYGIYDWIRNRLIRRLQSTG